LAEEPFVWLPHLPLEFGDDRAHLPLVLSVDDRLVGACAKRQFRD